MAVLNTKAFALFLKYGATLPTPPTNFIESSEKLILTPEPTATNKNRFSGKLLANDVQVDVDDTKIEGQSFMHDMRSTNFAQDAFDTVPEYAEILKGAGFTEVIDTATPGQETVTYTLNKDSAPQASSGIYYLDGKKQTMTDSLALDVGFEFNIGENAMISCALSGFLDKNGIAVDEANPTVTLSTEKQLIVRKDDVYTEGGNALVGARNINIAMTPTIAKRYGLNGLCKYSTTDFLPTITAEFPVDATDYNNAMQDLINGATKTIVIKIGTNGGTEVNGKTVVFTITNCKYLPSTETDVDDELYRTHTLSATASSEFTIRHGFFA